MTPRDFCYWLQGYIEIAESGGEPTISADQVACIKKHLELVFTNVTKDPVPVQWDAERLCRATTDATLGITTGGLRLC